jgi:hypothetical protein
MHSLQEPGQEWRGGSSLTDTFRRKRGNGLALLGLAAAVGLGYLAWRSFGPDLVRYMKIRSR